jgi:hypothetical protein
VLPTATPAVPSPLTPAALPQSPADEGARLLPALVRLAADTPASDQLVPAALEHLRAHSGAAACSVWAVDGAGEPTTLRWSAGSGPHAADCGRRHALGAGGTPVGVLVVDGGRDEPLTWCATSSRPSCTTPTTPRAPASRPWPRPRRRTPSGASSATSSTRSRSACT